MTDLTFLNIAKVISLESKCISLQVGAIIVKDDRIISCGYNGTVSGFINCDEAFDQQCFTREEHSEWSSIMEIHAEMNALMFAAKNGISVDGAIMYCTHQPCDNCVKHIMQAGIKEVVYAEKYKADRCKSPYATSDCIIIESLEERFKRKHKRDIELVSGYNNYSINFDVKVESSNKTLTNKIINRNFKYSKD